MLGSARPDAFDRLEFRWRGTVPSVGLVSLSASRSVEHVRAFLTERGFAVTIDNGTPHGVAFAVFLAALAEHDPVRALAERVAAAVGADPTALLARLRRDSDAIEPFSLAALGGDPALHVAVEAVLGPWRTIEDLWQRAGKIARRTQMSDVQVAAGFADLLGTKPSALILLAPADDHALAVASESVRMVEAQPQVRIVLAISAAASRRLEREESHSSALLREGAFEFDETSVVTNGAPASAERSELEGLRRLEPPVPPERAQRARSLAERMLFEALERRPATRGRFELNGCIEAPFGPRAAEIDLLDRRSAIAVEIDGFHHFTDADAYRRDRRKDVLLQHEGYFVIRILADDVLDAVEESVDRIVAASLRRRSRIANQ